MVPNFLVLLGCAFIPMITGMIYFHPKTMGLQWAETVGLSEAQLSEPPKWYAMVLSLLMNLFLCMGLFSMIVHHGHINSMVFPNFEELASGPAAEFMKSYGDKQIGLKHGFIHSIIAFVLVALPFLGHRAIWEKRGMKFIYINGLYWLLTIMIMGTIIGAYGAKVPV